MLEKKATLKFLKTMERIEYGKITITLPDGHIYVFEGEQQGRTADFHFGDWGVIPRLAAGGDVSFAKDYRDGLWDTFDLDSLLILGLQNAHVFKPYLYANKVFGFLNALTHLGQRNTLKGSRRNIPAHYDLGNDFYSQWLDPTMTYSSGVFKTGQETLEEAQMNKYDRIIDRLRMRSGSILEVGCGWGGFADRALERGDYDITGITLSQEQYDYAKKRLDNRAEIKLEDYRHQYGLYDGIVSIEMFEAVGREYWSTYFKKLSSLLNKNGRAVIQTIVMNDQDYDSYSKGTDFVRSFIFPGGFLPTFTLFAQNASDAGLRVADRVRFGQDYYKTLTMWRKKFDTVHKDITSLGFDDRFIRLWRFYLSACAAGFKTGRTDVVQVELRKT